jgi:hypothetical protein
MSQTHRPLSTIAEEILADYRSRGRPLYFGAVPYVDAMRSLNSVTDHYGYESGDMIVAYALSNLSTWRGDTAKRVKAELRAILASK